MLLNPGVRRQVRLSLLIGLLSSCALAQEVPPECPRQATAGVIENPSSWADRCFMAVNGRLPEADATGESSSDYRDVDVDGNEELLEVRGVGNASKQIYVFRPTESGFEYLGELNAHPTFAVSLDNRGIPTIEYGHRFGEDDVQLKRIQYIDVVFAEVGADQS
ncbi:MAG: hypothetical protein AAF680_00110 [Pseudomonadota bacterium]